MGTVGLSFGSPTSGTGFDVSSTVSSIVANLQNVETPWKSQLTSLESQDTVISSLGTLFSNLSNDLSSLTDFQGTMAQKLGSSSDTGVLTLTAATAAAVAGTNTVTVTNLAASSSGNFAEVPEPTSQLSGEVAIQVGTGTAQTFDMSTMTDPSLNGLAAAINASGVGVTANVLTDSSGSRLTLVSGTSGAGGDITVSSPVAGNPLRANLGYVGTAGNSAKNSIGSLDPITATDSVTGSISIQVGSGTAQTVTIPSGTPDTLAALALAINNTANIGVNATVVTSTDGTQASLALTSLTAGSAGTLTVTSNIQDPTASALGYTTQVSGADAVFTVNGIQTSSASNTIANVIPGVTFQLLAPSAVITGTDGNTLEQIQVVIANDNAGVESTFNSMVSDYNSLISAVNVQEGNDSSGNPEPLYGSPTLSLLQQQLLSGLNNQNPSGSLAAISTSTDTTLASGAGSAITIQVGTSGLSESFDVPASNPTLAGLADAINASNMGVTASVTTQNGESSLSLVSQTEGATGALTVTSTVKATSATPLTYSSGATTTTSATGTLSALALAGDFLGGSVSIQVGTGAVQSINVPASPNNTLSGLMTAINSANLGVTASLNTATVGTSAIGTILTLSSPNSAILNVTSSLLDTTNTSTSTLSYTSSSDISDLTTLGVSINNDGSISFDAASLDSVLNSDFSGVTGFFQSANSWGVNFSSMLTNSGTSSPTGVLTLAKTSNSNSESSLNADISKEEATISAQQKSLTTELNSANEIMQQIPTQLDGVNELYSAITGYNQNANG